MDYLTALRKIHETLRPSFYLEIGCRAGRSLALARCPSLAIDPDFEITCPLPAPTRLFRETSDEFFARPNVSEILGSAPDLAFIDGMHRVDFALRDFMNLEAHAATHTVIVIDDVLPGDIAWTTPTRQSQVWTGDVYRLIPLLRKYRPDLNIAVFDATIIGFGKGMAVIGGLDPTNQCLAANYDAIEAELNDGAFLESSSADIRSRLQVRDLSDFETHVATLAAPSKEPAT